MGGLNRSALAVERDHLVFHAGKIQLAGQFAQRAAFLGDGSDVVLLEQLHGFCSGFSIAVFEVIKHLSDELLVHFAQLLLYV